eukprot:4511261-Karenia_brevis.AAC.1
MVVSLELMIFDTTVLAFLRFVAWTKLLRIWGSLRSDDLQGLAPHFIRWMPSGTTGHLDRSKTSGPGRKKTLVGFPCEHGVLSVQAWLAERGI